MGQTVHLSVPAQPAFARTVRMLAANLAVLSGLTLDEVEDARMAAEEGFVYCCATHPEECVMDVTVGHGSMRMTFALGDGAAQSEDDPAFTYAELIISAVCDEYELDLDAGRLMLLKRTDVDDA